MSKAKRSIELAREYFISLGFTCSATRDPSANGHDLIVISPKGRGFTVEVKTACFNSRAWRVKRVLRKDSDLIAIVFPRGVHVESMLDYIKLCSKSGDRGLTAIGLIYE